MYNYRATVVRVVDGDTVDLLVDLGFAISRKERFRLAEINCPETTTPEGLEAKRYVTELLAPGQVVTIDTKKDRTDRYGRFIATIWLGEVNLNHKIVDDGHAVYVKY